MKVNLIEQAMFAEEVDPHVDNRCDYSFWRCCRRPCLSGNSTALPTRSVSAAGSSDARRVTGDHRRLRPIFTSPEPEIPLSYPSYGNGHHQGVLLADGAISRA